ncbi:MAG: proprotein convertase P-domain-containing protein, partial [Anaerolineales bacterium]
MTAIPGPALADPPPSPPAAPAEADGFSFDTPPGCDTALDNGSNSAVQNILDFDTVTSTITITSAGTSLWRLTVTTDITHTWNNDLSIFLTSPAGTRVSLSTRNGGDLDNVFHGTTWYDKAGVANAPGPVTLAGFDDGVAETPLAPEEPLGAFRGEDPNGPWMLEVDDDSADDQGQLLSWGLSLVTLISVPDTVIDSDYNPGSFPIPGDGTPVDIPVLIPQHWASLGDLTVSTNIVHPESNDLVIELLTPTGNPITLANRQGGLNADVFNGTVWNDKAGATNPPGPVTDNAYANSVTESPLAPQEPLGAASGKAPGGTWTLRVADVDNNVITGTIDGFTLNTTSYICRPDLSVTINEPEPARLNQPVPLLLVVGNAGAYTTAPTTLTATLPISASFLSAGGPNWTCGGVGVGQMGGTLLCSLGASLNSGEVSTVTVQLSSPAAPMYLGDVDVEVTSEGQETPYAENAAVRAAAHSANKQPWDVVENQLWPTGRSYASDSGGVDDGGQDAFDEWGNLRLRVFDGGNLVQATGILEHFGLVYSAGHRWHTTTPVLTGTIEVARSLYAPAEADWLRYLDTFTNTSGSSRTVWVAWGGDLGSDNATWTAASSSGDATITAADSWAVTIENDNPSPPGDAPVGYAWRSPADTSFQGPGIFTANPFTTTWPSSGNEFLGYTFKLTLAPGASASLAYFVYHGLAEGLPGPNGCYFYGDCLTPPAPGSQVALAEA